MGSKPCCGSSLAMPHSSLQCVNEVPHSQHQIILPQARTKPLPLQKTQQIKAEDDDRQLLILIANYDYLMMEQRFQRNIDWRTQKSIQSNNNTQSKSQKYNSHKTYSQCCKRRNATPPMPKHSILKQKSLSASQKNSVPKEVHFADYRIKRVTRNGYA